MRQARVKFDAVNYGVIEMHPVADLFPPPAHEMLIERRAAEFQAEIKAMAELARREINERFDRILAFHHRSAAQKRRFYRYRLLTGGRT